MGRDGTLPSFDLPQAAINLRRSLEDPIQTTADFLELN
jgi:hypothetical protein